MRRKNFARSRCSCWVATWVAVLPFLMNTAGWLLTESGRQPWIVQGLKLTTHGVSPRSASPAVIRLMVFVVLYSALGVLDVILMLRYSRKEIARRTPPPTTEHSGARDAVLGGAAMTLVAFWFLLIAIFWTGFFVLEGFDFGVGMLHAVVGRDEAEPPRRDQHDRAALGRQRGMADRRGRRHVRRLPRLVRDDVLGPVPGAGAAAGALMVRGVSFEYRGKWDARLAATWSWLLTIGSVLVPVLIGVALGDLLHGLPIDASQEYTGTFWTCCRPTGSSPASRCCRLR